MKRALRPLNGAAVSRAVAAIQKGALVATIGSLRRLGPARASDLGAAIFGRIGPLLPVTRVGHTNLRLAMPELDRTARRRILRGVWENLGRTIGEFPHLADLPLNTPSGPALIIDAVDRARLEALGDGPALLFSGHIGNWEALPRAAGICGAGFTSVYRAAGQQGVDQIILGLRRRALGPELATAPSSGTTPFAKGAAGARQALAHLRQGYRLGLLVDQKMNDGIAATLFGHPAMTAPALAAMALRFRAPVIGGWVERLGAARLQLHVTEQLTVPDDLARGEETTRAIARLTQAVNDQLEIWIRQSPQSWLWLHRRWPKSVYQRSDNQR